jgi:hypothetical protein
VIEVPTPDNFYHKFYKIGDAINWSTENL